MGLQSPCRFLRPTDCVVPLARAPTNKYSYGRRRRRRRKGKRKGRLPNIHPFVRRWLNLNWAARPGRRTANLNSDWLRGWRVRIGEHGSAKRWALGLVKKFPLFRSTSTFRKMKTSHLLACSPIPTLHPRSQSEFRFAVRRPGQPS